MNIKRIEKRLEKGEGIKDYIDLILFLNLYRKTVVIID